VDASRFLISRLAAPIVHSGSDELDIALEPAQPLLLRSVG
jgi:hypothetical protein